MNKNNTLPNDWKWVKLGEVCNIKTGKLDSNAAIENGTYPFFTCSREVFKINNYAFDCEAVLLAGNNASGDFNVKLYKGKFNAYQRTYVITLKKEFENIELYLIYLKIETHLVELKKMSIGSNTRYLKLPMIENIEIPLPPILEQQRLAKLLSEKLNIIEQVKQKVDAQIKAANELTSAYLRSVFESKEAKNWELVKLGDVCKVNPSKTKFKRNDNESTSFIPMCAVSEDAKGILNIEEKPFEKVKKGYTYFEENDVLFAKITPCMQNGKHAIARNLIGGFGFGTTEFHVIRASSKIIPEWIHNFIRQKKILDNAEKLLTGAVGQQRVPKEYLIELEIPLPPLARQKEIAHDLNEKLAIVEQLKSALQKQRDSIEQLPSAFLKQAFNGGL